MFTPQIGSQTARAKIFNQPEAKVPDKEMNVGHVPFDEINIIGPLMNQKIKNGELSIEDAQKIQDENVKKLVAEVSNPEITTNDQQKLKMLGKYILDGAVTIDRALQLTNNQFYILVHEPNIGLLIDNGFLSVDQAINLSEDELTTLSKHFISKFIIDGLLTVDKVMSMSAEKKSQFRCAIDWTWEYIEDGSLSVDQVINLSWNVLWNLSVEAIRENISSKLLTMDQAISLSREAGRLLNTPGVQSCIRNNSLTADQVIQLVDSDRFNSFNQEVKKIITTSFITQIEVNKIAWNARWDLVAKGIQLCTPGASLTLDKVAQCYVTKNWDFLAEAIQ